MENPYLKQGVHMDSLCGSPINTIFFKVLMYPVSYQKPIPDHLVHSCSPLFGERFPKSDP